MKKWGLTGILLEGGDYSLLDTDIPDDTNLSIEFPVPMFEDGGNELNFVSPQPTTDSGVISDLNSTADSQEYNNGVAETPLNSAHSHSFACISEVDRAPCSAPVLRSTSAVAYPGCSKSATNQQRTPFCPLIRERKKTNINEGAVENTESSKGDQQQCEAVDYDTDLEVDDDDDEEPDSEVKKSSAKVYIDECTKHKTLPASFLISNMEEGQLRMRHHYLGPIGAKALAMALQNNIVIDTLDVADNYFGEQGCIKLANVLKENDVISSLNVSMNFMGPKASAAFADMLEINMSLKTLKLQANKLGDSDARFIGEALKNNLSLLSLDLSNNDIGDAGAKAIAEGLALNVGLTDLDISWNCFRERGAASFAKALCTNTMLEILDLSWTCIGDLGSRVFCKALQTNTRLKVLDLSFTRLNFEQVAILSPGIQTNNSLETLLLNGNPLTEKGVDLLINTVRKGRQLRFLSIEDIPLQECHITKLKKMEAEMSDFVAMHSGVNGLLKKRQLTSVLILFDRFLEEHKETMIDLFNSLDSDGSGDVTLEELKLGFKEHGLRLTNRLIDMLLEEIDQDKSGTIEYEELLHAVSVARTTGEKQMILADPMNAIQEIRERRERQEAEARAAEETRRKRELEREAEARRLAILKLEEEVMARLAAQENDKLQNENKNENEKQNISDVNSLNEEINVCSKENNVSVNEELSDNISVITSNDEDPSMLDTNS